MKKRKETFQSHMAKEEGVWYIVFKGVDERMEKTVSGYCRNMDGARIVICDTDGSEPEIDCDYESCAYRAECTIGRQITQLLEQSECK